MATKSHNHITLFEIFNALVEDKKSVIFEKYSSCTDCLEKIRKAEALYNSLENRYSDPVEERYNLLIRTARTEEDFLKLFPELFSGLPEQQIKSKPFLLRPVFAGLTLLIVFIVILVLYNFFYFIFYPENKFFRLSEKRTVLRQGYFYSDFYLETNKILYNRDYIRDLHGETIIKVNNELEFMAKEKSYFAIDKKNDELGVNITLGLYFFKFHPPRTKNRYLLFPDNSKLIVHGTQIYVNVTNDYINILIVKGKADFMLPDGKTKNLDNMILYKINKNALCPVRFDLLDLKKGTVTTIKYITIDFEKQFDNSTFTVKNIRGENAK